ncbi:MAG: hypothetical protein CO099_09500 [Bdellovibrio sp. CG_4_9_14_3_um_filter_39_7]|nr:MAG: hypothetical protein CO099_09500 [Bdellovibrio sp. CG_4_9_14_3_um_filter_39_7]
MADHSLKESLIESIVTSFYKQATVDILIGYHFRKIATIQGEHALRPPYEAFSHHIPRIIAFWQLQLLGKTSFEFGEFKIFPIHDALHIRSGELDRWLVLFKKVLNQHENQNPEFIQLFREKLNHFELKFKKHYGFDSCD